MGKRVKAGGDQPPVASDRSKQLAKVCRRISEFQLWDQVKAPLIMRTRITSLNRALCCGGIPGGMLGVLHGPSQGGKSLLGAELLFDAIATGGWALLVDSEARSVDQRWYSAVCAAISEVVYDRPKTYEDAIANVEKFRRLFREAKRNGEMPETAMCCIMVDSINRLTPRDELEEYLKDAKVEPRGYPIRAMLTSKWLDKLIPDLERDEVMVWVQREGKKLDARPGQKTYTLKGGEAIRYDAGWTVRVTAAARHRAGDVKGAQLSGEKHELEVTKNSMGPHLDQIARFYSATGAEEGTSLGLDFAREVREESLERGLVSKRKLDGEEGGAQYVYADRAVAKSKPAYLTWLNAVGEDGEPNWRRLAAELDAAFEVSDE